MSLFGSTFPSSTVATSVFPSNTWGFGAQPTATTTQQQTALGGFPSFGATPFGNPVSTTMTAAVPSFGFGQQQSQPQMQQSLLQPQPTAVQNVGLGGARIDANLVGAQATGVGQSIKTPRETEVPAEILAVVEMLKQRMKDNNDLAEEIASIDTKMLDQQLENDYRLACVDYGKALSGVQKLIQMVKALKVESRQDLLDGEMAQRLQTSLAMNFEYTAPLNYLLRLAEHYEKLVLSYSEDLHRLEKLIFGQQKPITAEEISTHLKHVETVFRYLTAKVYEIDQTVKELKETFKDYRRSTYGDAARFFPSVGQSKAETRRFDRVEGPSPFSSSSSSALLVIANALSRAQAGTGIAPTTSLPMQQPFGSQASMGLGFQQQPQPFAMSQNIFRPFGSTPAAATVTTSATPFASGALSFTSSLGATTTTASLATTTTASPWRFSSPFNTSSSGTLFGGTATNIGAAKPLGLATPLQQSATPASLQLLNPPLGSKRGKS